MTTTASTTQTRTVDTSQLRVGDIVRAYGMRVRIEHVVTYDHGRDETWSCVGTVLNADEVKAGDLVPLSFLYCHGANDAVRDEVRHAHQQHHHGECWTIQGNTLATWAVEVQQCDAETATRACVLDAGHGGPHFDGGVEWPNPQPGTKAQFQTRNGTVCVLNSIAD